MKKTFVVLAGIALLSSVALPLYAQGGCVTPQKIQQPFLLSSALQVHFSSPFALASKLAAVHPSSSSQDRNSTEAGYQILPLVSHLKLNLYVNSSGCR